MNLKKNISVLHDHFLFSLTKEDYIEFRGLDIEPMPNIGSYHAEPTKPMTTFYGHTKPTTISESQTAFYNFKRGSKRDASAYPSSRMILTMIHFRDHFWQSSKPKDFMILLTPIMTQMMVISMKKNYFKRNNTLFTIYWLLPFRQQGGERWSKNLKEMEDPSFQSCTITTLSLMWHNMKL